VGIGPQSPARRKATDMKHIVQFSGGVGSWAAAKRVAERYGTDDLILLFADTLIEDHDLYRFLGEAAGNLGGECITISEGRTPWQVFKDEKYLGNSRIDPCSKILKRQLLWSWMEARYKPSECVVYLGIDWTESHRLEGVRKARPGWTIEAPLCDAPFVTKAEIIADLANHFIKPPRLYEMGFPHNNCGGFCVKAGQAQFKLLLEKMPERFAYHEAQEEQLRYSMGKDVSIMKNRRGGVTKPLTMKDLRERIQGKEPIDDHEWGGCGCAID